MRLQRDNEAAASIEVWISLGTKPLWSLVRVEFIGLRQPQRLPRCASCQGTYLGCDATPCIHLHLTQRASRDLISASLKKGGATSPRLRLTCCQRFSQAKRL